MTRMRQLTTVILSLVILSASVRETLSQTVAYKTSGTGIYAPLTGDYSGSGIGTHLGAHTFFGNIETSPTANPLVFDFNSTVDQETTAANGDKVFFSFSGQVTLIPLDATFTTFSAVWSGEFVVQGGTGRFANAKPAAEPLKVVAINDPFTFADAEWSFAWELSGEIKLR